MTLPAASGPDGGEEAEDASFASFMEALQQPTSPPPPPPPAAKKETPPRPAAAARAAPAPTPASKDPPSRGLVGGVTGRDLTGKDTSQAKSKDAKDKEDDKYAGAKSVSFFALLRHGTAADKAIMLVGIVLQMGVGVSMAAMNLVFGEMIDDLAAPSGSVRLGLGAAASSSRVPPSSPASRFGRVSLCHSSRASPGARHDQFHDSRHALPGHRVRGDGVRRHVLHPLGRGPDHQPREGGLRARGENK